MALPTLLPLRVKRSQRCERCGLHYPKKAERCPHCAELDEQELAALRERVAEEHAGAESLGRMMAVAAVVILVLMVMLVLI